LLVAAIALAVLRQAARQVLRLARLALHRRLPALAALRQAVRLVRLRQAAHRHQALAVPPVQIHAAVHVLTNGVLSLAGRRLEA
jgi:hypothetical protein